MSVVRPATWEPRLVCSHPNPNRILVFSALAVVAELETLSWRDFS
jgi:hypothetical protein